MARKSSGRKSQGKSAAAAPAAVDTPATPAPAPEMVDQPTPAETPALPSRSIVPPGYRARCVKDKEHKTPAGNVSVDIGDPLAEYLRGKSVEDVAAIAEAAGAGQAKVLLEKYAHLNKGQQRMNIGNRIRALVKDGSWQVPAKAA